MRSLLLFATVALASSAVAQTNFHGIYSCTNYTSRGALGTAAGDILVQVPATHFAGVVGDPSGVGTSLTAFNFITQDQNGVTPETYNMIVRADAAGAPDPSVAGLLLSAGPNTTPPSTTAGPVAWLITLTLTTPSTAVPSCATFYHGMNVIAAPGWTGDGQSNHICTYYLVGTTQGDNPAAPPDVVPDLAWNVLAGAPVQALTKRSIRMALGGTTSVLNMMNEDTTTLSTCVAAALFRSPGAGGMWPASDGDGQGLGRNDGLLGRITDVGNAGGIGVLFMSNASLCPGIPLSSLATGSLFLNPGVLLMIGSTGLDTAGVGVVPIIPQGFVLHASMRGAQLPFQGFAVGPAFALPGRLTNMAASTFL